MAITEVKARYMRRVQIAEYQPHEAEAQIKAQVLEGENAAQVTAMCMQNARSIVLAALGLVKPQEPAADPAKPASPVEASGGAAPAATEVKRGPGRPPKAKVDDVIPAAEAKDPAAIDDGMTIPAALVRPKGDAPLPAKTEAEVLAEIEGKAKPAEVATKSAEPEISEKELQIKCHEHALRLGNSDPIKKLMRDNYKIARLGEVRPDLRASFIKDLEALKK